MASTGMKKTDKPSAKGQKSISSFFAAKSTKDVGKRAAQGTQLPAEKRQKAEDAQISPDKENKDRSSEQAKQQPLSPAAPRQQAKNPELSAQKLNSTELAATSKQLDVEEPSRQDGVAATEEDSSAVALDPPVQLPLIGDRIKVLWPEEKEWFKGNVTSVGPNGKCFVEYDDGDTEWLTLAEQQWERLPAQDGDGHRKRKRSLVRKSSVILSSGSDSESLDDSEESSFEAGESSSSEADDDVEDLLDSDEEAGPMSEEQSKAARVPSKKAGSRAVRGPSSANKTSAARAGPPAQRQGGSSAQRRGSATPKAGHALAIATPSTSGRPEKCSALAGGDLDRYAARAAERFPFLHSDRIKDAKGRKPDHAEYDEGTLWIPGTWFKEAKVSEGQRQWWDFKAKHFDAVLLFKMGKFYEMFEMDAHTGAEVLGLIYMKGDQPHCGFPEANYHLHAERLARAGLKVVVVEQTETPDQLKIRNEQRRAAGKTKVGVVNREMVAVLTKGTLTDPEMLQSHSDASYIVALTEVATAQTNQPIVGLCAVDCATGQMLLGSWQDDEMRTSLRAHLAALRPTEVILPSQGVSSGTRKVLLACLRSPRINSLPVGTGFWSAAKTLEELKEAAYFIGSSDQGKWPAILSTIAESEDNSNKVALSAFGGAVSFLRSVLLDRSIVGLGRIELLQSISSSSVVDARPQAEAEPDYVALDGSALENLEVLETSGGETSGCLLTAMDACATPAGRRRLKDWLCRPLGSPEAIIARQDAVHELMTTASELAAEARASFAGMGDLERSIARLCASSLGAFGRDNASVVLYEDAAKRKVAAFLSVLRGLEKLEGALQSFESANLSSQVLGNLTTQGQRLPRFGEALKELLQAADWDAAAQQGRVVPNQGVSTEFDEAEGTLESVDEDLQTHLDDVKSRLKSNRSICYVSLNKDSHVLEIPEEIAKKVPHDFELVSQKKGFKRFMSPPLRSLLKQRGDALEAKETAMANILQGLVKRFAAEQRVWNGAVVAMSELDALMSLATAADTASAWGPVCRPIFVPAAPNGAQVFRAEELRHPVAYLQGGDFVSNDIDIGTPCSTVITGPNMGGKSTIIRQVCLAALLAHVGAFVPAKSLELSPVDAIFVRMGAKDSIMSGQSTFFVELTETAAALSRATCRSLVALDELGRGTSTTDGAAIASAVLHFLSSQTKCRSLFATHYHQLSDEYQNNPSVALKHMACHVQPREDGPEQVTFLYKLTQGSCPKSYGTNVARLAGLPAHLVQRASDMADILEKRAVDEAAEYGSETTNIRPLLAGLSKLFRNPAGCALQLDADLLRLQSQIRHHIPSQVQELVK